VRGCNWERQPPLLRVRRYGTLGCRGRLVVSLNSRLESNEEEMKVEVAYQGYKKEVTVSPKMGAPPLQHLWRYSVSQNPKPYNLNPGPYTSNAFLAIR